MTAAGVTDARMEIWVSRHPLGSWMMHLLVVSERVCLYYERMRELRRDGCQGVCAWACGFLCYHW